MIARVRVSLEVLSGLERERMFRTAADGSNIATVRKGLGCLCEVSLGQNCSVFVQVSSERS